MNTEMLKSPVEAAEIIKKGGLVAAPTETMYALCADGLDAKAVEKVYEAKGRPPVKPMSLLVSGSGAIGELCVDVPPQAYALAEKFWPGALTIVLKSNDKIPSVVRAGGSTVGLRCPDCAPQRAHCHKGRKHIIQNYLCRNNNTYRGKGLYHQGDRAVAYKGSIPGTAVLSLLTGPFGTAA